MTRADPRGVFAAAAGSFAALVRLVPESAWSNRGLGEWTVRDLVGHTSRSLITVSTYSRTPAPAGDALSPEQYYTSIREYMAGAGNDAIVERGRQAGRDLGDDPAATVEDLARQALADVQAAGDPVLEVIGGLRIRLSDYLPTRTFELAVHSLDIADAVGIDHALPAAVLADAAALAARVGVALGQGPTVLSALTGRAQLPTGFSVV